MGITINGLETRFQKPKGGENPFKSAPVSIIQTDSEEVAQSAYNEMIAVGDDVVAEIRYMYE